MVADFAASRSQAELADDLNPFDLNIQNLQWTFIEKLFAVHAAYAKDRALGKARHYYDLFKLCGCEEVQRLVNTEKWRKCMGEVRRVDADGLKELERSYRNERHLFFVTPPLLTEVLQTIRELLRGL